MIRFAPRYSPIITVPPEEREPLARQCAAATGLTTSEVLVIARIGPLRYKLYTIPKRNGEPRLICQPSRELKVLQYFFLNRIFPKLVVHRAATAYERGSSIRANAAAHMESRVIFKMDFENFFNSITTEDWVSYARSVFPEWTDADYLFSSRVLFFGAKTVQPRYLSIGAPTSPRLANALLSNFDHEVSSYCEAHRMVYTRYADDITISSKEYLDRVDVLKFVTQRLKSQAHPKLTLSPLKTGLFSRASSRRVTGITLANDGTLSLGRERKRLIRAMMHRVLLGKLDVDELVRIRGLIAFARDIEPSFVASLSLKYGDLSGLGL